MKATLARFVRGFQASLGKERELIEIELREGWGAGRPTARVGHSQLRPAVSHQARGRAQRGREAPTLGVRDFAKSTLQLS
jgi:hypothetical protein